MWFYLLPAAVNFIAKGKSFKKHLLLWISSIDKFLKFKMQLTLEQDGVRGTKHPCS